jgi:hypothetical protein
VHRALSPLDPQPPCPVHTGRRNHPAFAEIEARAAQVHAAGVEGDNQLGLGRDGCRQHVAIAWITAQLIGQTRRRLNQGFGEGLLRRRTEPTGPLRCGACISEKVADRVLEDLRRPMDPVQVFVSDLQQQISEPIGVEDAAVEQNWEDCRFQLKAHTTSTCISSPAH